MTDPLRKRKVDDVGLDVGGHPRKPKVNDDDMDQIISLVTYVVEQQYDENIEEVQELSPGFSSLPQEDVESLLSASLTSSLPQSFPGSQDWSFSGSQDESSFTDSPKGFGFAPPEHVEGSPQVQEFGDSFTFGSPAITTPIFTGEVSRDEDVVMSSLPAEEDDYVQTPTLRAEEQLEEVPTAETDEDLDDVPGYTKRKALEIFNQAWAELLKSVAGEQEIDESILEIETVRDYDQAKAECLSKIEEHITELVLSND